jgi:hypothetical protein
MSETAKDSVLFVILDLAFTISGSSQQLTANSLQTDGSKLTLTTFKMYS